MPLSVNLEVISPASQLPWWLGGKESAFNAGDTRDEGLIPGFDPLEEEMYTHSSILAWRIPLQRSLVGYNPSGCKELSRLSN